jgi:hypothetical protein
MMDATIETLEEEMGLYGVTWKRIALQPAHIQKYDLCEPTGRPFRPIYEKSEEYSAANGG